MGKMVAEIEPIVIPHHVIEKWKKEGVSQDEILRRNKTFYHHWRKNRYTNPQTRHRLFALRNRMASLYAEGVTVSEIATQFNLSISAVYNNIKSLPNYQSVKDQRQKNRAERLCEVCGGKHKARGLCVRCYDKWYWRNKNPRNKHLNNA